MEQQIISNAQDESQQPDSLPQQDTSEQSNASDRNVSIKQILLKSWNVFKGDIKFFALLLLAYLGVNILESALQNSVEKNSAGSFIILILTAVVNVFIAIGFTQVFLKITRGEKAQVKEMFGDSKYFWKYAGGSLLYGFIVFLGYILLIVPGIVWQIKYSLWPYLVIDKNMRPMEALKESGRIINGYKWKSLGLHLVMIPVFLLGLLCLVVGVFASYAVALLAFAYFYRIMIGERVME